MKLLLVEDDVRIVHGVKRGLEAEGWSVEVASDGDDGLWKAREGVWDVIILDVMLPGRSGYRVCRDLRASGDWTPILMLTAKDGELDEAEGLGIGADDWVTKPFSFPVLTARIHALVRRTTGRVETPLAVGNVRVDPGERRAWQGSTELSLTTREFDLLTFLLRRAGQVMSKSDILAGVWDYAFDGTENAVEVYVRRLRRKLAGDVIETVRGAGYRLKKP